MVFHPAQIIVRKRDGHALSDQQIDALIQHFSDGSLPDYQMAALAMAIFLQGMDANLALCEGKPIAELQALLS